MLNDEIINKLDPNIAFFRFKEFKPGIFLITNDVGEYLFLNQSEFEEFITGQTDKTSDLYKNLFSKGFIKENDDQYLNNLAPKYYQKNRGLLAGPSLHIVVVTMNCNHRCIYCQTSSHQDKGHVMNMSEDTAKKTVDIIFQTPNKYIAIEFQGGEPLINWETVKFIVEYALEKNKIAKKELEFRLVSNFSLMKPEILDYLIKKGVAICTSLDGNEETHNHNRQLSTGNSYQNVVKWVQDIRERYQKIGDRQLITSFKRGALLTVTRKTFSNWQKVIDAYRALGYEAIYLRYLNPYGEAKKKDDCSYLVEEFLEFYKKSLDYILEINKNGELFIEKIAQMFLTKILTPNDPNHLDWRSPCGAGTGEIAYYFNGDIYTCDEGRMIAAMGDDIFKIGNVSQNNLEDLINSDACKVCATASCIDGNQGYEDDVYKPYLGLCPVYNYTAYQNLFPAMVENQKWLMDRGIVEYLFEKLQDENNQEIFKSWIK